MSFPRTLGTHDGSFHADEVTACALLCLFKLVDLHLVIRSRDPQVLQRCEYVCDVGGIYDENQKRFDHHQVHYQGSLSSAGMVLLYLRNQGIISEELYEYYNHALILGVDAHDNGKVKLETGTATFSIVISNFLPIEHTASKQESDQAFFEAVRFVIGYLDRLHLRFLYMQSCAGKVKQAMQKGDLILLLEESLPWMDAFFEYGGTVHPAQFLIMPSENHWKLRGIPPDLNHRMEVRTPLPQKWGGLRDEELAKISGIGGAIFCHKGRFISIWKTKEDALKAAHLALQEK